VRARTVVRGASLIQVPTTSPHNSLLSPVPSLLPPPTTQTQENKTNNKTAKKDVKRERE